MSDARRPFAPVTPARSGRGRRRRTDGHQSDDLAPPTADVLSAIGNRGIGRLVQRGGFGDVMIEQQARDQERRARLPTLGEMERIAMIEEKLDTGWVDPGTESEIETIWASFGTRLPEVASRHAGVWAQSLDRGAEVADLSPMRSLRAAFGTDVKATTFDFLARNRKLLDAERKRLGITGPEGGMSTYGAITAGAATEEVQSTAAEALDVLRGEKALRNRVVGQRTMRHRGESYDMDIHFDPDRPRDSPVWQETKELWDALQGVRMEVGNASPGVFALMEHGGGGDLETVATTTPEHATAMIGDALTSVETKIGETEEALSTDDLDWHELKQVHQQLYAGRGKRTSADWTTSIPQSVAKDVVEDYDDAEWWKDIGLGTLAAAAFVFSELATGGLATFAWAAAGVGIGATQAAMSWENYDDLSTAAESGASYDTQVVSHAQARAARTKAILDTIFAVVDIPGGAGSMIRGVTKIAAERSLAVGARKTVQELITDLPHLATYSVEMQQQTLAASVRELGALQTIRRSGKSADELAEVVGRDSDTGKRLLAQSDTMAVPDTLIGSAVAMLQDHQKRSAVREMLARVTDLPQESAERVVREAIDTLGPAETLRRSGGWKTLSTKLGNGSDSGKRLDEWRSAIEADLVAEFGSDNVVRTGRKGMFSNDFDVSTLGKDAAANRERVITFLETRSGIPRTQLRSSLMFDVFTDPRRMHLATLGELGLPTELRERIVKEQATRQEQLIWNRRLHDALEEGVDEEIIALREQMSDLGIAEITDFRPLTAGEVERLGVQIDRKHGELVAAAEAGDHELVAKLADDIADRQALINASEGGGYFSGGGTRKYVSERDEVPGFGAGGAPPMMPAEQYLSFLDQSAKLDEVIPDLRRAIDARGTSEELEAALKALGKYGDRLGQDAGAVLHANLKIETEIGALEFMFLAKEARALKEAVESGAVKGSMASADAAAVLRTRAESLLDRIEAQSLSWKEALLESSGLGAVVSDFATANAGIRRELLVQRVVGIARIAFSELEKLAEVGVTREASAYDAPELPVE